MDEKNEKLAKSIIEKIVNAQYVEAENVEEDWSNEGMNIYFTKDIKGANEIVIHCGAPKILIEEKYIREYVEFQDILDVENFSCKQKFRFGPSIVYNSMEIVKIPIVFRSEDEGLQQQYIEAYVIQADVPLFLGLKYRRK